MSTATYTAAYTVTGMTCGGCVKNVKAAIGGLDGVEDVAIDFRSGTATVTSAAELDPEAVKAAVAAAGYTVA